MERWRVTANGGLRARVKPVTGTVKKVIPQGNVVNIYHKQKGSDGNWWGQLAPTEEKRGTKIVKVPGLWLCLKYAAHWYPRPSTPVPGHHMTTPYGKRKAGLWKTKGYHTGDDYAAPRGAEVVALTDGTIARAWDSYLGNVILLYSNNGDTYWYCHLSKFTRSSGRVHRGEVIGKVGDSGKGALGPHLHLERHNGHSKSWWAKDMKPTW